MTARAYVQIRPMSEQPVKVICHDCHLEQPAERWSAARDAARLHNARHHGQDHA